MAVRKKTKNLPPDPAKPPVWFSYWVENKFRQAIREEIKAAIHDFAIKNNLKE